MTPQDLIRDLRSRINPAYADQRGTESHERKVCADAMEMLVKERDEARLEILNLRELIVKVHAAKGRYHSQQAMCDLYDAVGLPNVRPVSTQKRPMTDAEIDAALYAELDRLTKVGAKAWAGVDPQKLRDGESV